MFKNKGVFLHYMAEISLCMITRNEERFLEQCLNSVKDLANEIIIVDTGSYDKTKEIARKFNAKIIDFKWIDDFSAARNESLKHATKDWILVLDADEVIDQENCEKIKEIIGANREFIGFSLQQRTYLNKPMHGAIKNESNFELVKDYPCYVFNNLVRLFKNNENLHFKHKVHELIEDSIRDKKGKYVKTSVTLHHLAMLKEDKHLRNKSEQYSNIILNQIKENPNSARYNYQAAKVCVGKKDFDNALKYFGEAAKIDPNYRLIFSEIAKVYLLKEDKEQAVIFYRKSVELNPDNPSAANNLAVTYMSMGKFKEAMELLEGHLKKHPQNAALKYNYGECLKKLEK
jgi:glycosyltransferase involved in cell wall biosynthesis